MFFLIILSIQILIFLCKESKFDILNISDNEIKTIQFKKGVNFYIFKYNKIPLKNNSSSTFIIQGLTFKNDLNYYLYQNKEDIIEINNEFTNYKNEKTVLSYDSGIIDTSKVKNDFYFVIKKPDSNLETTFTLISSTIKTFEDVFYEEYSFKNEVSYIFQTSFKHKNYVRVGAVAWNNGSETELIVTDQSEDITYKKKR